MRSEGLSGKKAVASYLGTGVRTVQRYKRELDLPVHRPSRNTPGSVIARRDTSRRLLHSTCKCLRHGILQVDQLVERMKSLQLDISAFREMQHWEGIG